MAELADALDLGSSGKPCRFKSCQPHQTKEKLIMKNGILVGFTEYQKVVAYNILKKVDRNQPSKKTCRIHSEQNLLKMLDSFRLSGKPKGDGTNHF